MARPTKVHRYDYTFRTLAYYQQQGGIYNDIITILQNLRQTCTRDRIGTPASILNEATYIMDDSKSVGSDIISDMREFKHLNSERMTSGTIDLIFACIYVLAFNELSEGARHEIIRLMDHRKVDVSELFKLAESQETQEEQEEQDMTMVADSDTTEAYGIEKDGKILVTINKGHLQGFGLYLDPEVVRKYDLEAPPDYLVMLNDLTNQLAAKEKQLLELRKAMSSNCGDQQVRSYKADIRLLSDSLNSARQKLLVEMKKNEQLRKEMDDSKKETEREIEKLTQTCNLRELEKEKLRNEAAELRQKLEEKIANKRVDIKSIDDVLTFEYILKYIEDKELYNEVKQLFEFLKRAMRRIATDEQYDRLDALEKKMLHNSVPSIYNHNQISNSTVLQGVMQSSNLPMGVGKEELEQLFFELLNKKLNHG